MKPRKLKMPGVMSFSMGGAVWASLYFQPTKVACTIQNRAKYTDNITLGVSAEREKILDEEYLE